MVIAVTYSTCEVSNASAIVRQKLIFTDTIFRFLLFVTEFLCQESALTPVLIALNKMPPF